MFELSSHLTAAEVVSFFCRHSHLGGDKTEIDWIIQQWPTLNQEYKTIESSQIKAVRQAIKKVATGKQRRYKKALDEVLHYLHQAHHWTLPEKIEQEFVDKERQRAEKLVYFAQHSQQLIELYETQKQQFLYDRKQPCSAFVCLVVVLEVAPFSFDYIAQILNDPNCIEQEGVTFKLRITHLRKYKKNETALFTRYHLPLFVFRVLKSYYDSKEDTTSAPSLYNQFNQYIEVSKSPLTVMKAHEWENCFQALWRYRDKVVPTFLSDIAAPERHVGFDANVIDQKQQVHQLSTIYDKDWDDAWFEKLPEPASHKTAWPHKELLTDWNKSKRINTDKTPAWELDNILPKMLFLYSKELVEFGGIKKEKLADSTLRKYCRIEPLLTSFPLAYADACSQNLTQQWAESVFKSLNSDAHRQVIHYFFRFLEQQPLTEHLESSQFSTPLSQNSVDPFCIGSEDFYSIIRALLTNDKGHLLQRLFSAVAAILSFFAMLRRGEILRLRCGDIRQSSTKQTFMLTIAKTKEGNTKSRKTRKVHISIPEEFAKLLRIVMHIKRTADHSEPLLGFTDEKSHSRQLHYLLPVSKALKAVCGEQVKLHHLRHSGIYLFYLQALHLATDTQPCETTKDPLLQRLLSEKAIINKDRRSAACALSGC